MIDIKLYTAQIAETIQPLLTQVGGADGKSAYDIAVELGFAGTEEQWLLSLKGDRGDSGSQGEMGAAGYTPQKGIDYFDGKLPLLFNLYSDPSEKYDLADQHPEIVERLTQIIYQQLDDAKRIGSFYE